MDLTVIYKFSVLSAVSKKIREVPFEHEQFCLSWPIVLEKKMPTGS